MNEHVSCKCCANHNMQKTSTYSKSDFIENYWKIILSLSMLLIGLIASYLSINFVNQKYVALVWYMLAYLPVGIPVLKEAWESIIQKDFFSEFTLMSIATLGAFFIGEYPEGVAVMLFYAIGEQFQDKAIDRAKRNISALLDVRPEKAAVLVNNILVIKPPQEVMIGEIIEIKPGERVPLDGKMLSPDAAFNTSALTGESVPRTIRKEEEVLAGMIVTDKMVQIRVTKIYTESALAKIIEMVEHASERKAPTELFIRKFARIYTPMVIAFSVLILLLPLAYSMINPQFTFVLNEWLYRSLIFLVISCPCALVISIPLGYFGGIGAASRLGILFKGGNYLDAITQINTVVFDKTGTLTKGNFEVQSCKSIPFLEEGKLIQLIASVEKNSTHPIAKAIERYAISRNIEFKPGIQVTEIAGHGLIATIDGKEIKVGNLRLLEKFQIPFPAELHLITATIVVCASNSEYMGYLTLSDSLKEDAVKAIDDLKSLKIRNIRMLSGDKSNIVVNFAKKLGISDAYGDLLPEGKVKHIEELRQDPANKIAFVGDGINDAPVLALSHIGIAMGGLGSDMAIETADVVIQTDQPSKIASAIKVGRQTRKIVWQNISLALGIKFLVLILGTFGIATLWEAVFADVGVTLIAILNAMRIQKLIK